MVKIPSIKIIWQIAAIGFGLIVSIAIIFILQYLNLLLYTSPESTDLFYIDIYSEFIAANPIFLTGNLLASLIGCSVGCAIAILVRPDLSVLKSLNVGFILLILSLINTIIVQHPAWFVILTILLYLPFSYLGAIFIKHQIDKHSA